MAVTHSQWHVAAGLRGKLKISRCGAIAAMLRKLAFAAAAHAHLDAVPQPAPAPVGGQKAGGRHSKRQRGGSAAGADAVVGQVPARPSSQGHLCVEAGVSFEQQHGLHGNA